MFSDIWLTRLALLITIGDFQSKGNFPSVPAPPNKFHQYAHWRLGGRSALLAMVVITAMGFPRAPHVMAHFTSTELTRMLSNRYPLYAIARALVVISIRFARVTYLMSHFC